MAVTTESSPDAVAIRPFRVEIPEQALDDLRRRIAATRWPSRELVADRSQGVQLATLQELARYWTTEYDWRACEARLNALPQFTTGIDGSTRWKASSARPPCAAGSVSGPTVSSSSITEPGQPWVMISGSAFS